MHSKTLKIASLAILSFGLFGCPKETPKEGGEGKTASGGGNASIRIAVIPKGTSHSFWKGMEAGAKAAGKEQKVEIIWQGPDKENDITSQVNLVQDQANKSVQGVVLAATDATALVAPIKGLKAKGIPVVTVDSGVKEDVADCYIATDNVLGGKLAAQELAKAIGDKGKVVMLAFLKGAVSNDEREKGFTDELKKHPGIQLVSTQYGNSAADALDKTTNMFTANPEIVGIFAASEPNGVGAANYIRQNKLMEKVKLVAYDTSPEEVAALKEGTIGALIVQNPWEMGYQGVKTVLKAINKKPIDKKFLDSGVVVVNKANMGQPHVLRLLTVPKTD